MHTDAQAHHGTTGPRLRRGVKALVTRGDAVLLVKERHADGAPFWTLPGGGIEPGESRTVGLRRELQEELDCRAVIGEPVATFCYAHRSGPSTLSVYTVRECTLCSAITPNAAHGILGAQWVARDAVPPRTLLPVRALWT